MAQLKEREEAKTVKAHPSGKREKKKEKKPGFKRSWVKTPTILQNFEYHVSFQHLSVVLLLLFLQLFLFLKNSIHPLTRN